MDLSQIPLELLQEEHAAVDAISDREDFAGHPTALCIRRSCTGCPVHSACDELCDPAPGWPECKERYLLALRAEIERRS